MIRRLFPSYPVAGFAPNFTGYDWDKQDINWYETYEFLAQAPNMSMFWVSFNYYINSLKLSNVKRDNKIIQICSKLSIVEQYTACYYT